MLKEPLFKILSLHHGEDTINVTLEIDQHHIIFEGHFPDQPVVPGASMLQLVKEVLEKALGAPLRLKKADNIKFLSLIEPGTNQQLQLHINYQVVESDIKINANLTAGDVICMKLRGIFITA
jgi:3-hydroxyacyl-[acyl-carrier-protein] dehydratase